MGYGQNIRPFPSNSYVTTQPEYNRMIRTLRLERFANVVSIAAEHETRLRRRCWGWMDLSWLVTTWQKMLLRRKAAETRMCTPACTKLGKMATALGLKMEKSIHVGRTVPVSSFVSLVTYWRDLRTATVIRHNVQHMNSDIYDKLQKYVHEMLRTTRSVLRFPKTESGQPMRKSWAKNTPVCFFYFPKFFPRRILFWFHLSTESTPLNRPVILVHNLNAAESLSFVVPHLRLLFVDISC